MGSVKSDKRISEKFVLNMWRDIEIFFWQKIKERYNHMFLISENFIMLSFIIMFCAVILLSLVIVLWQWHKNKQSPLIVTQATVLTKRIEKHSRQTRNASGFGTRTHKFKLYYVTFQLEGGENIELLINVKVYNVIRKGQQGKLTFKGSKYLDFEIEE